MTVKIRVDEKQLEVKKGQSVLQACLANDITIPNLCFMEGMSEPPASCRLCFVQVAGMDKPVTSCTVEVADGMVVHTDTPAVRRLQRSGLRLLLSVHEVDCKNCPANKQCALQDLARFLNVGLKTKRFEHYLKDVGMDDSHPTLTHFPNRCVLCGKCIHVCRTTHDRPLPALAGRGFDTVINFYGAWEPDNIPCNDCSACADICPVGALVLKSD